MPAQRQRHRQKRVGCRKGLQRFRCKAARRSTLLPAAPDLSLANGMDNQDK